MKYCKTCELTKNELEFHKCKSAKDGLQRVCKLCHIEAVTKNRQTEAGKISHRKANHKYHKTAAGKVVHDKAYKKWAATEHGKENIKVRQRKYQYKRYKADPEYYNLKCRAYHAGVPLGILKQVLERDKTCQLCHTDKNLQFDHIYPISEGGLGSLENLQLLCWKCNNFKSNHFFLPDGGMMVTGKQVYQ